MTSKVTCQFCASQVQKSSLRKHHRSLYCQAEKLRNELFDGGFGLCSMSESLLVAAGVPYKLYSSTYSRNIWKNVQEWRPQVWMQRDCADALNTMRNALLVEVEEDVPWEHQVAMARKIGRDPEHAKAFLAAYSLGAPFSSIVQSYL